MSHTIARRWRDFSRNPLVGFSLAVLVFGPFVFAFVLGWTPGIIAYLVFLCGCVACGAIRGIVDGLRRHKAAVREAWRRESILNARRLGREERSELDAITAQRPPR